MGRKERKKEKVCTRERHMQCVRTCTGSCCKVQAAAKGCESRTDLTYRGRCSHLFQGMVNNIMVLFFLLFLGGKIANSVCFIPRLTACWVIYS